MNNKAIDESKNESIGSKVSGCRLCRVYFLCQKSLAWMAMGEVKHGRPSPPLINERHSPCAYPVPGAMLSTSTLHVLLPQLIFKETLFGRYLY